MAEIVPVFSHSSCFYFSLSQFNSSCSFCFSHPAREELRFLPRTGIRFLSPIFLNFAKGGLRARAEVSGSPSFFSGLLSCYSFVYFASLLACLG
jgi:hypothetical protein